MLIVIPASCRRVGVSAILIGGARGIVNIFSARGKFLKMLQRRRYKYRASVIFVTEFGSKTESFWDSVFIYNSMNRNLSEFAICKAKASQKNKKLHNVFWINLTVIKLCPKMISKSGLFRWQTGQPYIYFCSSILSNKKCMSNNSFIFSEKRLIRHKICKASVRQFWIWIGKIVWKKRNKNGSEFTDNADADIHLIAADCTVLFARLGSRDWKRSSRELTIIAARGVIVFREGQELTVYKHELIFLWFLASNILINPK